MEISVVLDAICAIQKQLDEEAQPITGLNGF
jgi:hypothetical protein